MEIKIVKAEMHIAASNPLAIDKDGISDKNSMIVKDKELEIGLKQKF